LTIKQLDEEEFMLFKSWTEKILTRNIQPEEKNEVVTILQETRPEEVEQMISNVERVLKKTYKDAEIKGIEQGIEQGVTKVAQQMLLEDVDIGIIKRCTGLSDEEIEKLKIVSQ
jgi:predicted transposase/invertase (TIGR01784 family)